MARKKITLAVALIILLALSAGCRGNATNNKTATVSTPVTSFGNVLVAYFSRTGNTQTVAQYIHEIVGGDLFEIVTAEPYPSDYNERLNIARRELQNNFRPALAAQVENMDKYDTIFIGHPIWHGHTPMAIHSFLEAYDFSGKTIIPFSTSGSSGNNQAMTTVRNMCPNSIVMDGFLITRSVFSNAKNLTAAWIDGMNINTVNSPDNIMNIQIGKTVLTAALVNNSSTTALKELLARGPITIDMRDYGNFEKVGLLGARLPENNERITTEPGDLILYQGNAFVIYYAPNTWSLTRLGRINNVTQAELREVLGGGNVSVTLSLSNVKL